VTDSSYHMIITEYWTAHDFQGFVYVASHYRT